MVYGQTLRCQATSLQLLARLLIRSEACERDAITLTHNPPAIMLPLPLPLHPVASLAMELCVCLHIGCPSGHAAWSLVMPLTPLCILDAESEGRQAEAGKLAVCAKALKPFISLARHDSGA